MALILISSVWIFSFAGMLLRCVVSHSTFTQETFFSGLTLHAAGLLCDSLLLPVIFKFGSEKGRLAYYIIIIVTCVVGTIMISISEEMNISLPDRIPAFTISAAAAILFVLSWLLSIRIYEKREL